MHFVQNYLLCASLTFAGRLIPGCAQIRIHLCNCPCDSSLIITRIWLCYLQLATCFKKWYRYVHVRTCTRTAQPQLRNVNFGLEYLEYIATCKRMHAFAHKFRCKHVRSVCVSHLCVSCLQVTCETDMYYRHCKQVCKIYYPMP